MAEEGQAELDVSFTVIGENAYKRKKPLTKRQQNKEERYRRKLPLPITCKHGQKSAFMCNTITNQEAQEFNKNYYAFENKKDRDAFILKHIIVEKKKRSRLKENENGKLKIRKRESAETPIFIRNYLKSNVRVCKDTFRRSLGGLGRKVIETIAKKYIADGHCANEKRGGDRKSIKYAGKRELIHTFIKSLKARESHYGRGKSRRVYLPLELQSIKDVWRFFLETNSISNDDVNYRYFYNVFKKDFNIGFGSIKTDTCSFCESYIYKIRSEKDSITKNKLMAEKRIHKKRASAFYELVSEWRDGLQTYCYDHQQNLVCPKVPDQQAYYSRQLYTYNFAVVRIREDKKITKENSFVYTWNECDLKKDSSACCSALYDALKKDNFQGIDTVRFCSDACGGQNKNSTLIFTAVHWLQNDAPINVKTVELVFPVRGHSFLPCDRFFGLIEKEIRKKQCIFSPKEYYEIFEKFGQVLKVDFDWKVYDFKACADSIFLKPLPIKIQENKRFYISRSGRIGKTMRVSGEQFYRSRLNESVKLEKRGKSFSTKPMSLLIGDPVSALKKKDVNNLMNAHCGSNWMEDERFEFLANFISKHKESGDVNCDDDDECNCLDRETEVMSV